MLLVQPARDEMETPLVKISKHVPPPGKTFVQTTTALVKPGVMEVTTGVGTGKVVKVLVT